MRSVAIVGVGLIGGSFGLALRAAGFHRPNCRCQFTARPFEEAIACGAIDSGVTLEEAASRLRSYLYRSANFHD